jgi:tRNA-dihydrouridine synthase C
LHDSYELHLAPMEGVVDFVLRDVLTDIGGIDHCVTEFIRVTDKLHSAPVIHRYAPELAMGSRTRSGTVLFLQFLGGQPGPMAENAAHAAELGALGIDLNFGCPAKTVNRHDGGASLLKTPERIFQIVKAVRAAVPASIPVTAKMRLGFEDPKVCIANAEAVQAGGAQWLTVHCRTKTDGYRPPAYWEWIPRIQEKISIPIVANGEIWTVQDFWNCAQATGSQKIMIGRGAVAQPFLFRQIKDSVSKHQPALKSWEQTRNLIPQFFKASADWKSPFFAQARTKQWLKALALQNQEAKPLFEELKVFTNPEQFRSRLENLCS